MDLLVATVQVVTILFLVVWGAGVFPGTIQGLAIILSAIALAVVWHRSYRQRLSPTAISRPTLEYAVAGILLLLVLTCIPWPAWLTGLWGNPRADEHRTVRDTLAQAAALQLLPSADAAPWFAFTCHRGGTLRLLLLGIAMASAAFLSTSLTPRYKRILLWWLAGIGACVAVAGILNQCWSAPDDHRLWWLIPIDHRRASTVGCFLNRNHFAGFLALFGPVTVALSAESILQRRWRGTIGALLLFLTISVGIAFSLSRGGFIAYAAGLGITVWGLFRRYGGRYAGWGLAIAVATILALLSSLPSTRARMATLLQPESNPSVQSRTAQWRDCLRIWPAYAWGGVGANALRMVYPRYRTTTTGGFLTHAENNYVQLLVEGGLIGVLLFGLLGFAFWRRFRDCHRATDGPAPSLALAVGGACTVVAVHSLCDFALYLPLYAITAAILVGLLLEPAPLGRPGFLQRLHPAGAMALLPALGGLTAIGATALSLTMIRLDQPDFLPRADLPVLARAVVWAPTSWEAWYYLGLKACAGDAERFGSRYRFGAQCLRQAAEYDPMNYRLWHELGQVRWRAGDTVGAQEAFRQAEQRGSWLPVPPSLK